MAGYSRSDFDVNDRAAGPQRQLPSGAYGGGQWAAGLRGGVAYSWHDIATRRSVAMPGFSDRLGRLRRPQRPGLRGPELSHRPVRRRAGTLRQPGLRQSAHRRLSRAAARPRCMRQARRARRSSTLGARATSRFELGGRRRAAGSLGWRHATGDVKPRATQAFSEGESFTVAGVALARNSAVIEAGLDLQATRKTRVGLAYQGLLSGSARDHGAREPDRSFLGAAGSRRSGGASRPYQGPSHGFSLPGNPRDLPRSAPASAPAGWEVHAHVVDGIRIVREGDDLPRLPCAVGVWSSISIRVGAENPAKGSQPSWNQPSWIRGRAAWAARSRHSAARGCAGRATA